jgi:hypothetical protein
MIRTGYGIMTSARSVCMNVSRVSGAGLCGVGSITQHASDSFPLNICIYIITGYALKMIKRFLIFS